MVILAFFFGHWVSSNFGNAASMMLATKERYDAFAYRREQPEPRFEKDVPDWPLLDVSRNTLWFDFITMGELFQNNHR